MPSRDSIISRARKFRALTASPNEHEAASARDLLAALVKKHRLTKRELADVQEITEVVEEAADEYRAFACGIACSAHKCRPRFRGRTVAFAGAPEDVRRAIGLYRQMLEFYAASVTYMRYHTAWWLHESCEVVWKFHWWTAFAEAVRARQPGARKKSEAITATVSRAKEASATEARAMKEARVAEEAEGAGDGGDRAAGEDGDEGGAAAEAEERQRDLVTDVRVTTGELWRNIDMHWFQGFAQAHGGTSGTNIPLRLEASEFWLPAKSTA